MPSELFSNYAARLQSILQTYDWTPVEKLAKALQEAWKNKNHVYICGNGGSAGNAIHLANDYLYGISKSDGIGLKVTALPANSAVLTCLANDISYADIYSQQLSVLGNKNDILIVFSGSGNSPNIVKALERGKELGMKTFAVLGYKGGKCLELAEVPIHFQVMDMQISEDLQLIVGHMLMQWLCANPPA